MPLVWQNNITQIESMKVAFKTLVLFAFLFAMFFFARIETDTQVTKIYSTDEKHDLFCIETSKTHLFYKNQYGLLDSIQKGTINDFGFMAEEAYIQKNFYRPKSKMIRSILPSLWSKVIINVPTAGIGIGNKSQE
ncbi:MAG: hypothetical protein PEPC_01726 [Peptostreptococcus russellii]